MHDPNLEGRVRDVLRAEGDALPLTITAEALEHRLNLRRRGQIGRQFTFAAAAVAVVALVAITSGWFWSASVGSGPSAANPQSAEPAQSVTPGSTGVRLIAPFPLLATATTTFLDESSETTTPTETTGAVDITIVGQVLPVARYVVSVACDGPSPVLWSIGHEGQHEFLAEWDVACDRSLTTHEIDQGTPNAPLDVVVRADRSTAWRIRVVTADPAPSFIPPVLRMIETGNKGREAVAAEAFGRCAALADSTVQCGGEWLDTDGRIPARVQQQGRVTFGFADGWQISEARVTAVSSDLVRQGVFAPEYSVELIEEGGALVTVQVPLDPGAWIVRVALNASRVGETFSAHYDFALVVEAAAREAAIPTVHGNQSGDVLLLDIPIGACASMVNVLQVGPDLGHADEVIDDAGDSEGWIKSSLSDGRPASLFHGGVEAAALAYGGVRLAIGAGSPWILKGDGSAHELRSATTPGGRTLWWTGNSSRRVPCREAAAAQSLAGRGQPLW